MQGWDTVKMNDNEKQTDLFFKVSMGKNQIRLVSHPIQYHTHWMNGKSVKCTAGSNSGECEGCSKDIPRKVRYLIWVIDRADGGIKIFQFGPAIMKGFKTYYDTTGIDPSTKDGPDFCIVKTQKTNDKLSTEYNVVNLGATPLTTKEIVEVNAKKSMVDINKYK